MKLTRILNVNGDTIEVETCPRNVLNSMRQLRDYLHLHACRLYGVEGRNFRVCQTANRGALVPIYVNEIIAGANGMMENGESLVIQ